jgi:hypothetical protein
MATHSFSGAALTLVEIVMFTCPVCVKQVNNHEWIFMKFSIGNFYEKLCTVLINFFEEDVHAFPHSYQA